MVNDLAKYSVFLTFNLKNAYHQIKLKESDKKFTAFEANGRLYQFCRVSFGVDYKFCRVPFGVSSVVAVFQ